MVDGEAVEVGVGVDVAGRSRQGHLETVELDHPCVEGRPAGCAPELVQPVDLDQDGVEGLREKEAIHHAFKQGALSTEPGDGGSILGDPGYPHGEVRIGERAAALKV